MRVTKERVLELLTQVVEEKGADYRYTSPSKDIHPATACLYWHVPYEDDKPLINAGTPGCIAGQVFHRLGVPGQTLYEYEGQNAVFVANRLEPYDLQFDRDAKAAREVVPGAR